MTSFGGPLLARFLAAAEASLQACAVCFGPSDGSMLPRAYLWGVVLLLAPTFAILIALAYAVRRLEGRMRAKDAGTTPGGR